MIPSTERPEARIATSFVSEITELQMSVRFVHVGKEVAEARRIFHSAARKNDVRKDFGRALLLRERAPSIWKRNPLNVGEIAVGFSISCAAPEDCGTDINPNGLRNLAWSQICGG